MLEHRESLALARGYSADDLYAVAEVAYAYLFGGHEKLALVLFEGLVAVAPGQPYFSLAVGLACDLLGDVERADLFYQRAAKLDPDDARPDVNRAEIMIERGRYKEARALLEVARKKPARDPVLSTKLVELISHLDRTLRAHGSRRVIAPR